jgi:hypothetical protein
MNVSVPHNAATPILIDCTGGTGADSFTYKGVSPGSGSGPSDEVGPERTVNLRIGAGTPPACADLSQSVPQNTATNLGSSARRAATRSSATRSRIRPTAAL